MKVKTDPTLVKAALKVLGAYWHKKRALRYSLKYLSDFQIFRKKGGTISDIFPIIDEFSENAGVASGHYFHQDLLVASYIHSNNPQRHIDIGSRIDGFVAHVASFRKIEVMDIRHIEQSPHENILFFQADLMNDLEQLHNTADSISCLHTIEHFGLGRYGDRIDPKGHIKGFNHILNMLKKGGTLYISFPIATENHVYFNAHRVFHPEDIFNWSNTQLKLLRFDFVDDEGNLHKNSTFNDIPQTTRYGCGIYTFTKT
jgi:hypothetical protein